MSVLTVLQNRGAEQSKCALHGLCAYLRSAPAEVMLFHRHTIIHIASNEYQTDRLFFVSAVRTRNAGNRNRDIRTRCEDGTDCPFSRAVCVLTAPYFFRVDLLTFRRRRFDLFE